MAAASAGQRLITRRILQCLEQVVKSVPHLEKSIRRIERNYGKLIIQIQILSFEVDIWYQFKEQKSQVPELGSRHIRAAAGGISHATGIRGSNR